MGNYLVTRKQLLQCEVEDFRIDLETLSIRIIFSFKF